jgi:hypothetical protein
MRSALKAHLCAWLFAAFGVACVGKTINLGSAVGGSEGTDASASAEHDGVGGDGAIAPDAKAGSPDASMGSPCDTRSTRMTCEGDEYCEQVVGAAFGRCMKRLPDPAPCEGCTDSLLPPGDAGPELGGITH